MTGHGRHRRELRLVVRRTRLTDAAQRRLWPDWRHHAFITNVELPTVAVDQFHRDHATVELAIRDLKEGAGLEHCPSGRFFANAAWLGCAVLAHNLIRWTARLGDVHPAEQLTVARTIRTRLLELPGRLVNRSRQWVLRLPHDGHGPTELQHRARPDPLTAAAHLTPPPRTGAAADDHHALTPPSTPSTAHSDTPPAALNPAHTTTGPTQPPTRHHAPPTRSRSVDRG